MAIRAPGGGNKVELVNTCQMSKKLEGDQLGQSKKLKEESLRKSSSLFWRAGPIWLKFAWCQNTKIYFVLLWLESLKFNVLLVVMFMFINIL